MCLSLYKQNIQQYVKKIFYDKITLHVSSVLNLKIFKKFQYFFSCRA